jgi:hypothetical protein
VGSGKSLFRLLINRVTPTQGNIGGTEKGIPFLEDDEIIPFIIDMAGSSPVLSVRG